MTLNEVFLHDSFFCEYATWLISPWVRYDMTWLIPYVICGMTLNYVFLHDSFFLWICLAVCFAFCCSVLQSCVLLFSPLCSLAVLTIYSRISHVTNESVMSHMSEPCHILLSNVTCESVLSHMTGWCHVRLTPPSMYSSRFHNDAYIYIYITLSLSLLFIHTHAYIHIYICLTFLLSFQIWYIYMHIYVWTQQPAFSWLIEETHS